ncbi:GntR family transcriptional regulator [Streptomyces mashuensis]|uniref:GntR family transcriptional regulator n=1 Tax=Streptomyces mashuensis TaxID=33904 RepID=A0A919EFP5_9ACTN|nr:GntR family transcriptional regulator [Streptomyces mashuensis]GHF67579.1 GntR family transcriptional regulator [Streptomyces mashuensis]
MTAEKNSASGSAPPYLRIVADIRRRIARGELRPGDRVPSTRQLAREWEVALATATKALTVLRQEGLVRAEPRVGTLVAPARRTTPPASPAAQPPAPAPGPRPSAGQDLTRDRIVRAAVELADAEGLDALSMRGIAARLGTSAMTAYRYVDSKNTLVLLMADAVLGECAYPDPAPAGWRERLETGALALWAVHRAHPWLAHVSPLHRPLMLPNMIAYAEWMLGGLDGHGFAPTTLLDLNVLLYSHVQGMAAHLEREAQEESATGVSDQEWLDAQAPATEAVLASGRYPVFTRLLGAIGDNGYDLRLDDLFALGLTALLDGVERLVREHAGGPPR